MSGDELRVLPTVRDRRCWARGLDNRLRRRWAPPDRELDLLDVQPKEVVADLGAGPGYFDEAILARIGPEGRLYLVDIDAANLDLARRRFRGDLRVTCEVASAASAASVPTEGVDRVLLSLVLCCLADKSGALAETWRVLRPGGRALVTFPKAGRRWGWRRRSLGVTHAIWTRLVAERSWQERPVRSGWVVERHLLEKPGSPSRSGDGTVPG